MNFRQGKCECGRLFIASGRGRPRLRCHGCSKDQIGKSRVAEPFAPKHGRQCRWCSAEFLAKMPHARFCSGRCGDAANNVEKQVRRRNRSSRPCRTCGTAFAPGYGDMRRVYCSAACGKAGDDARPSKRGKAHVRRARLFGGAIENFDPVRVFERDAWTCWICHAPTPRSLRGTFDPSAPELDHVIPLSKGGAHTRENARCACRECNQARGNSGSMYWDELPMPKDCGWTGGF